MRFVEEAFSSNYIAPLGPMVDAFEREFSAYIGIPHCVALASGTAATHLAIRHLRVGPGDEVLTSTLTFIGSVTPVIFQGATPVFVDCDALTWNLDPNLLEQELRAAARRGRLPKAVIPTDLYGQCCDLPLIRRLCDRYEVPVVCDCAEAMGAMYEQQAVNRGAQASDDNLPAASPLGSQHTNKRRSETQGPSTEWRAPAPRDESVGYAGPSTWRHAGYDAWASVYSFNGNKIITTSGGGMLASHDKQLIDHARKLSQQSRDSAPWYEHTEIGYNYRMSNIVAAIGRGQLKVLDQRIIRRRAIFTQYQERLGVLPGISFMPEATHNRANRWLTVILIDPTACGADTHAVREALERENIEARPVWKPMHMQPVFSSTRCIGGTVSERLFARGLCLPSGTAMTDADVARVANVIERTIVRVHP